MPNSGYYDPSFGTKLNVVWGSCAAVLTDAIFEPAALSAALQITPEELDQMQHGKMQITKDHLKKLTVYFGVKAEHQDSFIKAVHHLSVIQFSGYLADRRDALIDALVAA